MAAVAVLGLGVLAAWSVGGHGDDSPLFARVVVPPGADPSALPMAVPDAHVIEVDRTGALLVHAGSRVRREEKPRAYQDIGGRRLEVSVRFDIAPAGEPRLLVGPYDRTFPLVIETVQHQ